MQIKLVSCPRSSSIANQSTTWLPELILDWYYHAAKKENVAMEEPQHLQRVPLYGEGSREEHMLPNLLVSREEQVRVENEIAAGYGTNSPQLFAQITSGDDSATTDIAGTLRHETDASRILEENRINVDPVIDNGIQPGTLLNGFGAAQEHEFAIPDANLPLLPLLEEMSMPDAATSIIDSEPRVQAFAKLEFDDGQFYMNTWSVELGRDMRAARKALHQEFEGQDQQNSSASKHRSNSSADGGHSSVKNKDETRKIAGSVISETGGILNVGPEAPPKATKSSKKRTKSEGSLSRIVSRSDSMMDIAMETESVNPKDLSFDRPSVAVQPVNPQTHLPSPDECPLIPINPPATDAGAAVGHRGISRRHVKIQYSFERRLFEMEVKGRNGAFVDEIYYGAGEIAELRSRCYIQIGGVGIRFILPNVADGETGAEPTLASEAISAMSFDFEDGKGESVAMAEMSDSSSELVITSEEDRRGRRRKPRSIDQDMEDDDRDSQPIQQTGGKKSQRHKKPGKGRDAIPKLKLKLKAPPKQPSEEPSQSPNDRDTPSVEMDEEALKALGIDVPLSLIPPRRKGPGRPPKNGFMSKREEASLKKQAREAAKAQYGPDGVYSVDVMPSPNDVSDKGKLLKNENSRDIHESIEDNDGMQAMLPPKMPKEKKPPKPPKSLSPFVDAALLTPEQLAKPQHSYVVMIHEALSNCPAGQMSLPQIYKAIERKYPYFKFKVTTPGWQSSIRHNLSQHLAFKKTETREGKGWMWCLDADVSIEKEKRPRRPSPPPMTNQPYFPQGSNVYRPPFNYQNMPPTPANNGSIKSQFNYQTTKGPFQASPLTRGPNDSAVSASKGDVNGLYQSPYGSNARNANSINPNTHHSMSVPAVANPYLHAQTMHHQPQTSTSRPFNPSNPQASGVANGMSNLSTQCLSAIAKYKSTLMGSLPMANKENIINTVIDKVIGRPYTELTSFGDRSAASAIEIPLIGLLQGIREGEQKLERQRLSQIAAASNGTNGVSPSLPVSRSAQAPGSTLATISTSTEGVTPGPDPSAKQTMVTAPNSDPSRGSSTSASITAQTPQTTSSVQSPTIIPTTTQPTHTTPAISPITPVHAASPAPASSTSTPISTTLATPPQTNDQTKFLSILSQLGPSNGVKPAAPTKLDHDEPQHNELTNGTRGTKRSLEVDDETDLTSGTDASTNSTTDTEQSRAAKRVAI